MTNDTDNYTLWNLTQQTYKTNKTLFVIAIKYFLRKNQSHIAAIFYLKPIVICTPHVRPKSGASHMHVRIIQRGVGRGSNRYSLPEVASSSSPVTWENREILRLKPLFLNNKIIFRHIYKVSNIIYVPRYSFGIRAAAWIFILIPLPDGFPNRTRF